MSDAMKAEIKDAMSPQAVALLHAHIVTISGDYIVTISGDSDAAREARWFAAALVEIVGGPDAMNALYEEVGV